jgi:hypothetical protein
VPLPLAADPFELRRESVEEACPRNEPELATCERAITSGSPGLPNRRWPAVELDIATG